MKILLLDYLKLTSPRISMLVVLTGFAGIWAGSGGRASLSLIIPCLAGIGLASAGASVFNNYFDRDIDRLMKRTSGRPLPSGRLNPAPSLCFGILLSITAFAILILFVGEVPAFLALLAVFVYSFLYTVLLKRRTPLATEIGGVSGALPPVIGWVAAGGGIGVEASVLFAMMFLWQPPHFWSLAMSHRDDYVKASIPSMPVVISGESMKMRSLIYILALVTVSFMPYIMGMTGRTYLFVSILSGILYISLGLAVFFLKKDINRVIFLYSIIYISVNFTFLTFNVQNM